MDHGTDVDKHRLIVAWYFAVQDALSHHHAVAKQYMVQRTLQEVHSLLELFCEVAWVAHVTLEDTEQFLVLRLVGCEHGVNRVFVDEDSNLGLL